MGFAQLVFTVDLRGRQEDVDAPAVTGRFDGGGGGVDVAGGAACQTGDDRAAHLGGDLLDRVEVAVADDRETGLDDINVEAGELARDLHFLAQVHGRARALFAVAQGGIKNQDFVGHKNWNERLRGEKTPAGTSAAAAERLASRAGQP